MATVIDTTVINNLCCGCGTCSALCPSHALEMQWNAYGEYTPIKIRACVHECGLCLKVCPFSDTNANESVIGKLLYGNEIGIQYKSETGYFFSSFVGAVTDEERRWKSASGGLASWFLEKLLVDKIVDAILCVKKSDDDKCLYKFFVATTPDEVRSSAGSVYYPTEMSEVIKYVLKNTGKYAVIGIPCFVKALRLASTTNKLLKERIVIIAGLTCGQMKNRNYTKYVGNLSGLTEDIKDVSFRCKSMERSASLFSFNFIGVNGYKTSLVWDQGIAQIWSSRAFTLSACDFCDDIAAECADVAFMDAWLPEYSKDPRGTSLIIVRRERIHNVFLSGLHDGSLWISPIPITKILASINGVVEIKRPKLEYRLYRLRPQISKRVFPSKKLPLMEKRKCNKEMKIREITRDIYLRHHNDMTKIQPEIDTLMHETLIEQKIYLVTRTFRNLLKK